MPEPCPTLPYSFFGLKSATGPAGDPPHGPSKERFEFMFSPFGSHRVEIKQTGPGLQDMPYFFICPIYVLLVFGLLGLAFAVRLTGKYRIYSSYIVFGAIGTFPGFLLGNALFWVLFIGGVLLLKQMPFEMSGDVGNTLAAVGLAGLFVAGLAFANVVGCVGGFVSGLWLRKKMMKKAGSSDADSSGF